MRARDFAWVWFAILAPLVVMAMVTWRVAQAELYTIATTAAQAALAESEAFVDRMATPLAQEASLVGQACDAATIARLDRLAAAARVARDVGLYDGQSRLYCSARGRRHMDLTNLQAGRSLPLGADLALAGEPLSPVPAIAVDVAISDKGGLIALGDVALMSDMAAPFPLAQDGGLIVRLAQGGVVRQAGLAAEALAGERVQVTAVSGRYGMTAHVKLQRLAEFKLAWNHLPLFGGLGAMFAGLSGALVYRLLKSQHSMSRAIRIALQRGEFEVHYQPVIALGDQSCVGAEALIRWRHPERGLIRPDLFIPVAEDSGLIEPITRHVMTQVRHDLLYGGLPPHFHIAINVAAGHFTSGTLIADLDAIFPSAALAPERVFLEVTERTPLGPEGRLVLDQVRDQGFKLAVDDFGTGHSGLAYLQHYRFDVLKIDQLFVRSIGTGAVNASVVDAIIQLGRDLGADLIAEGIETPEQFEFLRKRGVAFGQGWLFAKAMPLNELKAYVQRHNRAPAPTGDLFAQRVS